jgi:DNA-binding CsgD family transcriptional regulator
MDAPPVQYVTTSDGCRIAHTVTGQGEPLVLLPAPFSHLGLPPDPEATRLIVQPLAARFRLVQYDSRGQGLSTRGLPDNLKIDDFLHDLDAVIGQLRTESVILMATIGFWRVAVRFAALHPSRCHAVVLVRPDHPVEGSRLPKHPFEDIATLSWESFLHTMIATYPLVQGVRYTVSGLRQAITQEDYIRLLRAIHACDSGPTLRSLKTPALVIAERVPGMNDSESMVEPAQQIAALIQGPRFAVFEGYGQAFYSGSTDLSPGMHLILDFIEGLPGHGQQHVLAAASHDRLSSREIEVLRLIAAGKSNAQIAGDLVISQNTVIRHVSNIYAKTGAANRAEATAYALRHGLA